MRNLMGALTLKPSSSEFRKWESFSFEGFDLTDSFGLAAKFYIRENRVFGVEPLDPELPWLADRGRLFFEGAFVGKKVDPGFREWLNIFDQIKIKIYFEDHFRFKFLDLNKERTTFVFKRLSTESLILLNQLENKFSYINVRSEKPISKNVDLEEFFYSPASIESHLARSSLAVLIGTNPRYEAYAFNLNLLQRFHKGGFEVLTLGPKPRLTVPSENVGSCYNKLFFFYEGVDTICQSIVTSDTPIFLINSEFFKQPGLDHTHTNVKLIKTFNNSLGSLLTLPDKLETPGANSLRRYKHVTLTDLDMSSIIYCLNLDISINSEFESLLMLKVLNCGNRSAEKLSVFNHSDLNYNLPYDKDVFKKFVTKLTFFHLPVNSVFAENLTYRNSRGLVKKNVRVLNTSRSLKSNWQVLKHLYLELSRLDLVSNKNDSLRVSSCLANQANHNKYDHLLFNPTSIISYVGVGSGNKGLFSPFLNEVLGRGKFKNFKDSIRFSKVRYWLDDFFIGGNKDSLSPNSPTLLKCSKTVRLGSTNFF